MSLEAVKTISEAEKEAEIQRAEAGARCRRDVAEAEAAAKQAIADAKRQAAAESEKIRRDEEEALTAELKAIVDNTQNKKAAIRARAESRLENAADLIAGRIVNT